MKAILFPGLFAVAALAVPQASRAQDDQPKPEESAILPGVGGQGDSAAPTMALDCEATPEACVERLDPGDVADRDAAAEAMTSTPSDAPAPAPRP